MSGVVKPNPVKVKGVLFRTNPKEDEKNKPTPQDSTLNIETSKQKVVPEDEETGEGTTVPVMLAKTKPVPSGLAVPMMPITKPVLARTKAVVPPIVAPTVKPVAVKPLEEKPATTTTTTAVSTKRKVKAEEKPVLQKLKTIFDAMTAKGESISDIMAEEQDGLFFFPLEIPVSQAELSLLDSEFQTLRFKPNGFLIADPEDPRHDADLALFFELMEVASEEKAKTETKSILPKLEEQVEDFDFSETDFAELAHAIEEEKTKSPYVTPKPASGYVPQTRRSFAHFITQTFKDFALAAPPSEPDYDACFKMGAQGATKAEIYSYQQFVRDYMSWATPYRGILVYHGLGSGKTCTAIAAAEALNATANRKIIVMTPYSLRKNFLNEISFCGFRHYRLLNHWTKHPNNPQSDPLVRMFATKVLNIPVNYLQKRTVKHIWIPDFSKLQNFQAPPDATAEEKAKYLSSADQQEIREQIQATIIWDPTKGGVHKDGRIWFINYNGIPAKTLKELACRKPSNVFDNAVIIVDEIHNLTRLMQGTIEPYLSKLKGLKRKLDYEPITYEKWAPKLCGKGQNYKRGYLFYRLLLEAQGTKIVGLSGTPLINFPEELGILANVLHGYLHEVEGLFPITGSSEKDEPRRKGIEDIVKTNRYTDFYRVTITDRAIQMTCTMLPEGIRKVSGGSIGVERIPPGESPVPFKERLDSLKAELASKGLKPQADFVVNSLPLLPPEGESFRESFLEADGVTLKNRIVLMKRLSGLVSYYKGARKDLMPQVTKDVVVRVPFSPYQQERYSQVRLEEIDIEEKKKAPEGGLQAGRLGEIYAQIYQLTSVKQNSNYRMGSRQACNFVFPSDMARPRPKTSKEALEEIKGDKEDIIDGVIDAGADAGSVVLDDMEAEEERRERELVEQEEEQTEKEQEEQFVAMKQADLQEQGLAGEELKKAVEALRKEFQQMQEQVVLEEKPLVAGEALTEEAKCRIPRLPGEKYTDATERMKVCLLKFKKAQLNVADPNGLEQLSSKYKAMMDRIVESKGSSLVYSQFLTMEGIGIFTTVMRANGFDPIEIDVKGGAHFSDATVASLKKGPDANQFRFITFTGGEDEEVRRYAIDIFNARFSNLPKAMADVLSEAGYKDNKTGQLCRVFCITSAGAEGLSLKNVRTVHIMEPYWNDVRTAQVKGRAVRICSHMDLPVPERTVEIFTYLSVFSDKAQLASSAPPEAMAQLVAQDPELPTYRISQKIYLRDSLERNEAVSVGLPIPEKAKSYTLTSDERLYIISQRKKALITNMERAMKSIAADCFLNFKENDDGTYKCLLLEQVGDFMYHPELSKDITETTDVMKETAPVALATQAMETAKGTQVGEAPKPVTIAPTRKGIKAKFTDPSGEKRTFILLPVVDATKKITHYDIFEETDVLFQTVKGRVDADPITGKPKAGSQTFN